MQISRIQKLITFSPQLYQLVEKNAADLGISFPEYIRVLAVNDVKKMVEKMSFVNEEVEEQIAKSIEDIKNKNYVTLSSEDELDSHLQSI